MEVNNKYQVGQKVYFLDNGKAKCEEVMCVIFFVYRDSVSISYSFQKGSANKYENEVFPTESELKTYVFEDLYNE